MTSAELKAEIRAFIYDKDAYTSNGAANVVHAMDLLIDELSGGGGGGSSLFPTTGTGTATGDVNGNLAGNKLSIMNGQVGLNMSAPFSENRWIQVQNGANDYDLLHVDTTPNAEHSVMASYNTNFPGESSLAYFETQTTDEQGQFDMRAEFKDNTNFARIRAVANATTSTIIHQATNHRFDNIQEFADNAAALAGGLTAGMDYRTGDFKKIVH